MDDKILNEAGRSRKNRRSVERDSAAAAIILQTVLDSRRAAEGN